MITFKQYLIEARPAAQKTLRTFDLSGTYVVYSPDAQTIVKGPERGSWKGIRFLQSGRGWHGEKIFTLLKPEPIVVEVDRDLEHPKYVGVRIISGGDQPVAEWAKRPYKKKKTGETNPNMVLGGYVLDPRLVNQYGVWDENKIVIRRKDLK